jgi:hypothetical protein
VSTPPRVTAEQAADAVARIHARRHAVDDPNAHRLDDDALQTLLYLRQHSDGIPDTVRQADIADALLLRVHLWWEAESLELWLLKMAAQLGIPHRQVGRVLGIRTRQGVRDRRDRKEALLGPAGVPDEKLTRAGRRPATDADTWLSHNGPQVRALASTLLANQSRLPDSDYFEDLAVVLPGPHESAQVGAKVMAVLRLLIAELRSETGCLPGDLKETLAWGTELVTEHRKLLGPA